MADEDQDEMVQVKLKDSYAGRNAGETFWTTRGQAGLIRAAGAGSIVTGATYVPSGAHARDEPAPAVAIPTQSPPSPSASRAAKIAEELPASPAIKRTA